MFACDAGMGSSAMGASVLRKKVRAAGHGDVTVVNKAIANLTTRRPGGHPPGPDAIGHASGRPRPFTSRWTTSWPARATTRSSPCSGRAEPQWPRRPRARPRATCWLASRSCSAARPAPADDAITEAGRLLVAAGAVDESYIDSMHERETSVSTMMGNGLAIPHGTNEAKGSIRRSAMSFVRYDDGIDWNGKPAEFVVGIAGAGDDHLGAAAKHRHGVRRPVAGGPAPCRHLGRRGARGPRRGECLTHTSTVRDERTLGSSDPWVRSSRTIGARGQPAAVTATGTPLSAALPETSSSSGSVRSLIETPATSRLRVISTPSRAWP